VHQAVEDGSETKKCYPIHFSGCWRVVVRGMCQQEISVKVKYHAYIHLQINVNICNKIHKHTRDLSPSFPMFWWIGWVFISSMMGGGDFFLHHEDGPRSMGVPAMMVRTLRG